VIFDTGSFHLLNAGSAPNATRRLTLGIGKGKIRRPGMPTGTVKWFNTTKGFGFIAPDNGGNDIFVHISAVERSGLTGLADGQKVEFSLQDGRDGRQMAGDIKLL
jgi:CspA family cold shock protein